MSKHTESRYSPDELRAMEEELASLSLDDFPLEDEPSRVLEGLAVTPESLASRLMGQVVYQINRRLGEAGDGGMTKTALADRMGVSKSQVSRLLKAQKNTTLLTIARAAVALGLTDAVLKLIPEGADQVDEVKAFVEAEDGPWWPLTERHAVLASILSSGAMSTGWDDALSVFLNHPPRDAAAPEPMQNSPLPIDLGGAVSSANDYSYSLSA